jgi:glycosyltransferase involved in cell wall biosynthesis
MRVSDPSRPRAAILVGNPANPYSRALRLGRALVDLGFDVEVAATYDPSAPLEQVDGELVIRRYRPSGPWRGFAAAHGAGRGPRPSTLVRIVRGLRYRVAAWTMWPVIVRGWWHTLERELPPADLYHACGTLPIAAALAARDRDRKAGRSSVVIFDVIDITMEGNNVLHIPTPVRWFLARRERRWARAADGVTAVSDHVADWAESHWDLPVRPTVVANYPERVPEPIDPRPDLVRQATGLPASTRIVLFWGRLGPNLGTAEAADAILLLPDTALVLLGFGRGWEASLARDADPRYVGRHYTLPAVHPDELPIWVASADVALCTLPAVSMNQRTAAPNKFFEAMTGGLPVVLGPDLPTMEAVLTKEDLGRVAASMEPADIAAAVRDILDRTSEDMAAWRARIRATARERYAWPIAAAAYQDLVRRLRPGTRAT